MAKESTSGEQQLYKERTNLELFEYVNASLRNEETFHFFSFEFLRRLNIVRLQNDLIAFKEDIFRDPNSAFDNDKLTKLLESYTTAIRDYDFIHAADRLDPATTEQRKQSLKYRFQSITTSHKYTRPFESHYYSLHGGSHQKHDILRDAARRLLPVRLSYSLQERKFRAKEFEEGKPPIGISAFVDNIVRFSVSCAALLALVTPMCIMSLQPSLTKNLVTSSVFMILFACGVSFGVKCSNVETLVATATYSAVLVVFVGTNGQSSP